MRRRLQIQIAACMLATLAMGAESSPGRTTAGGADFVPGQVIVKFDGQRFGRAVELPERVGVREATGALRRSPRVDYAVPNYIATASAKAAVFASGVPNDPGALPAALGLPGGWVSRQWNFLPWEGPGTPELPTSAGGIDAVGAWRNLAAVGNPGAAGVTVAVLDTGVAYRAKDSRFRRSPDFGSGQFVKGYDFVADDPVPLDQNGHGTHVAGTIAEKTDNGIGLTGLAYRAKLMPVRVLDRHGRGEADDIARGIRFAATHGADVINMSFNFGCGKAVPDVDSALDLARARGAVTVASVGNLGSETCVSPPATGPHVIGVGGSTEGGCLGGYSLAGKDIDVVAPGGGPPLGGCASVAARPIYQVTLRAGSTRRFGIPSNYVGTSMAAAHVSAGAAMVLAAGVFPPAMKKRGRVAAVAQRLRVSARSLAQPKTLQGAGLIDLRKATDPSLR